MEAHIVYNQSGDATPIVKFDPADKVRITGSAWSSDGKTIFYARRTEESCSIIAHDLKTGKEKELCQEEVGWPGLAVSPDGRLLAFGDRKALKVMPIEGGEPRELHNEKNFARGCGLTWTPDGRYILCGKYTKYPLAGLLRVPAEGGEPQKLLEERPGSISVHPDGQRIAFTRGGMGQPQVWAMDNILTTFAADK